MHGRDGEQRKRRRHMRPVPAPGTAASALPPPARLAAPLTPSAYDSLQSSVDYFIKDGRKIRVGDCALFQAGNAPPFIGIIRRFSTGKEDYLKLCVNWLYRPADVKLAKSITPEVAPNEVFYSFHKDVISAASLLHPCKVAFLRKGAELPAGISSFVCRRVYDITNKRLWWLTDQDYINERQEEIDQLLDKTRLEMHAAVQSGGRSPKPLNGPTSTQQPKSGSDSVQNSGTSFPSQSKGKKRDRGDQSVEPLKRERSAKTDDGDSVNFKFDNMIRAEIAKITEKGGLVNTEGVEKLVNIMQLDRNERKIDLAGRVMLADVIAATDKYDCLGRFVQLRGVPVLDDWLQEAHKGKTGDGNSPKESDKATEELLLALLRALDKLPVNLNALQTCNVGKSVNHLRSHKNLEIQKKARSLVDTWKKRVDAEMKISDAKSVGSSQAVAWPVKPGFSDVSHAGNRRPGSSEVTVKSPMNQPSPCKTLPSKPGHADSMTKTTLVAAGSLKLQSPASGTVSKDSVGKTGGGSGTQELPSTAVKEEKSSSSSQSQNNSQSCSSDHAKTMGSSWKEDARSSTAGSVNASKTSGGSSRHRRSGNGLLGTSNSAVQKEPILGKSGSLNRTMTLDKASQSGLTCEKTLDVPVTDHGNGHRLIVRLPNPGRSPARSGSGGSFEDPSVTGSRASSPGALDKHEHNDRKMKLRSDTCRSHITTDANAESWQSNDVKEGIVGSDEADRSPIGVLDEERRSADETGKVSDVPRTACSSSGNEKEVFLSEPRTRNSFSSINALIESCAKYSEACAPLSAGDDIGMNLLASVAAGEMSKSDLISPTGSPETSPAREDPCTGTNEAKSRLSCDDGIAQNHAQSDETADVDSKKHGKGICSMLARGDSQQAGTDFPVDNRTVMLAQDHRLPGEQTEQSPVSGTSFHRTTDSSMKLEGKFEEERADRCYSMSSPANVKELSEGDGTYPHRDKQMTSGQVTDSCTDCNPKLRSPSLDENKTIDCTCEKIGEGSICASGGVCNSLADASGFEKTTSCRKSEKRVVEESPSCPLINKEPPGGATLTDQQQPAAAENHAEAFDRNGDDAIASSGADKVLCPENDDESKNKKTDNLGTGNLDLCASERKENSRISSSSIDERGGSAAVSLVSGNGVDENLEKKEPSEVSPVGAANNQPPCSIPPQVTEPCAMSSGSKMCGAYPDGKVELASSAEASSLVVTAETDVSAKLDFDLNEGIPGDDGNQGEPATSAAPVCSSAVHMPNLSLFASPMSNGLPAPITVAAPAKGPFVPHEKLLKTKAEPGWKGSAATSAFRPAEPRKVLEMPLSTSEVPASDAAGKQGRPPLDIDLNVPDERVVEDLASRSPAQTSGSESRVISNRDAPTRTAGGLDLDLNRVDEGTDGQFLASTSRRLEVPLLPARPASGGFSSGEANILRDFDLNNGPGLDEVGSEPAPRNQHVKNSSSMPFLPSVAGLKLNNAESGNVSSWFPPSNSYPAVAIPSFLPDRGEQPYPMVAAPGTQRILGSVTGGGTFGNDIYRGPVLSSSPAMAFSPAAFTYAAFPFGSSFPLASTSFSGVSTTYVDSSSGGASCFPVISSQLVGPAGAVSSHYPRPYVISLPESSASGGSDNSRKWARQGLDLNAGPGSADMEGKDDRLPSASRQLLVATSQAFVEEQARMFQVPGGGLKRKEPEGGWDAERYKQLSRQ